MYYLSEADVEVLANSPYISNISQLSLGELSDESEQVLANSTQLHPKARGRFEELVYWSNIDLMS